MKLIIAGCLILLMAIVLFSLTSSRKSTNDDILSDSSDSCSIVSSISEYDLYEDIRDFMTKQTAYIQSIMT